MIRFNNLEDAAEICRMAPTTFHSSVDQCISRADRDGFMGGTILTDYTGEGGSICMHVSAKHPNWLSRDLLWVTFHYAFRQLKCARAFVQVKSSNEKSLRFTDKLGFKLVTVIPGVFSDGDMHVKCLEADACRWVRLQPRGFVLGDSNG